jgi:ABC-type nitrate/sulfonate/bicarbonate transport system substrate-binding protein
VKLAIISEGFHMWPLYVAHARRFFEREGVDVQTTLTGASGRQLEALIQGDFEIGLQQSDHIVRAVEQGSDLFIFMANAPQPDLNLVVAPGIRTFADLRGCTVAVDGARSGYALLQSRLLARQGLREGDYAVIEKGGVKARFDALQSGLATAAWLNPPYDEWLFASGFGTLGSVAQFFPGYPGSIAAARRSWARAHPDELVRFIRAFIAAYAWMLEAGNRQEAEQIAMARLGTDQKQTAAAWAAFTSKPRADVTAEAVQQVIDAVWEAERYTQPKGAPDKYMDLSYLARAQGGSKTGSQPQINTDEHR